MCTFPFDINSWGKYFIAFVWATIAFVIIASMKMLSSIFQFDVCFYTIGIIRDQQEIPMNLGKHKHSEISIIFLLFYLLYSFDAD